MHGYGRPLLAIARARRRRMTEDLTGSNDPALMTLQAVENLSLPAFLDSLDPHRRDVDRHSVLEPRAEKSVHVRVCRPILAAVLMDREDALNSPSGTAEGSLHGIAQDPLREMAVEALEAPHRRVVHGHDEAEVGRVPKPAAVIAQGPP